MVGRATDADRQAAARAGLAAAREGRAVGPAAEAQALRSAYLDLLKLCLCDLTGTTTVSVAAMPDGTVASRELRDDQLRLRSAGMDWPLQGLTMVGLARLDDLQACVESVVRDRVQGDLIEAGAWRGGASILMRATLDSLGSDDRAVWVADSFEGFPRADDAEAYEARLSAFDFLAVPLEEVRDNFRRFGCDRGVRFVPGLFKETLPSLGDRRWAVLRLDGDTYDATKVALGSLYRGLSVGGYVIVDDYGALAECRRAVDEFRAEQEIMEPLEEVDWTCVRWRRESDALIEGPPPAHTSRRENGARADLTVAAPRDSGVPTFREVELAREIADLRSRLAAAESELDRMRGSPPRRVAAWLRGRLGRRA
jgi:O-methyltransferase